MKNFALAAVIVAAALTAVSIAAQDGAVEGGAWEYKVIIILPQGWPAEERSAEEVPAEPSEQNPIIRMQQRMEQTLNTAAAEGWELVEVADGFLYLKRSR